MFRIRFHFFPGFFNFYSLDDALALNLCLPLVHLGLQGVFQFCKNKKKTKNRRKRKELDQSIPIMFRLHAIRSSSSSQQHGRFGQSSVTVSSMFTCQFVLIGLFGLFGQLLGRLLFPHQWIVRLLLSLGLRSFHLLLDFILKENSKTKVNTQRKKKKQTKQIQTKRETVRGGPKRPVVKIYRYSSDALGHEPSALLFFSLY